MRYFCMICMRPIQRICFSDADIDSKWVALVTLIRIVWLAVRSHKVGKEGILHAVYQGGSDMRMMSSSVPFGNPGVLRVSGSASFSRSRAVK